MQGACGSGWRRRFERRAIRPGSPTALSRSTGRRFRLLPASSTLSNGARPSSGWGQLIEQGDDALAIRERPAVAAPVEALTIDEDGDAPGEIALDSEDEADIIDAEEPADPAAPPRMPDDPGVDPKAAAKQSRRFRLF